MYEDYKCPPNDLNGNCLNITDKEKAQDSHVRALYREMKIGFNN